MFSTFSYKEGDLILDQKVWADFQVHIPLIRSFSHGDNLPPEYPTYTGTNTKYHFGFYYLVALMEKAGMRIDIAMNLLSTLGMIGLIFAIFILARKITKSNLAAWLSVFFLLFNSSLSWWYFLDKNLVDGSIFSSLISQENFAAFGPWDNNVLSAFWHLNIFTNQRHLAFSFAVTFLIIWLLCYSKNKYAKYFGIIIFAFIPIINKAMLLILAVLIGLIFLAEKEKRKQIFISSLIGGILALPSLIFLSQGGSEGISFKPGFLYNSTSWKEFFITNPFLKWIGYWFINLGLLPLVFLYQWIKSKPSELGSKNKLNFFLTRERLWGTAAIIIFLIANLFKLSPDIINNHKLINFSIFIANIYAAWLVTNLLKKSFIKKALGVLFIIFLSLGGIVDLFPIFNSKKYPWADLEKDTVAMWINQNTPKDSKFLNLTFDTNSITIAGRRIFLGWPYYPWSMGYDTKTREQSIQSIASGNMNKPQLCSFLEKNDLDYIYIIDYEESHLSTKIDKNYFDKNFNSIAKKLSGKTIYDVEKSCD